ncbi:hypothetical protein [Pelagibius sp. Alg239-R121]|uniref:hypothetical protein n=1 Tax=Pelagibius sp. Alg239-R121 TaxID=2993448 RepID=UPI0024A71EC0|nr:hypothetical protein [Pelagibius sp. Alg239-R121]
MLFNPDNWDVQVNTDALDAIQDSIHELYEVSQDDDNDDNWHEEYSNRVYQLAVRTLEKLKRNLFFSGNFYLNVWVSASEVPYAKAVSWSKRLNDRDTHMSFVKWLDASGPS